MVKIIIAQFEEYDRRIFWALLSFLGIFLAAYIYFLAVSVSAVVLRKSAEQEVSRMTASISELESEYVALDKDIDLALAYERGFADIGTPRYISSIPPVQTFSLRSPVRP